MIGLKPFGLFLEGKTWVGGWLDLRKRRVEPMRLVSVAPDQVGPNRDRDHYDALGRYLWWGC